MPLLILASCPVPDRPAGATRLYGGMKITVLPGSLAHEFYGKTEVTEEFMCSYELNPAFMDRLRNAGLKISGLSEDGGTRIIELPQHPFFLATGFVPDMSSAEGRPHPLIAAFLKSASGRKEA